MSKVSAYRLSDAIKVVQMFDSKAEDHYALTCLSNEGLSHKHNIGFRLTTAPQLNMG